MLLLHGYQCASGVLTPTSAAQPQVVAEESEATHGHADAVGSCAAQAKAAAGSPTPQLAARGESAQAGTRTDQSGQLRSSPGGSLSLAQLCVLRT
ncbi:hypothetical protein GCM10009687_52940 [Asanoa iriomotensis]|uniref:Uncharacterized protein n=2 Tax=Asanoa iriomotensis TaxID=234613 RepID=A0ABQ4BVL0_9ACTN|nr:hypothetical protein Air01nite_06700 [Asanoa iriomotensis]